MQVLGVRSSRIDVELAEMAANMASRWPPDRANAVLARFDLGTEKRQMMSLANAAAYAGVSRETIRRDRQAILKSIAEDSRMVRAASQLHSIARNLGGGATAAGVGNAAYRSKILSHPSQLQPTWNVLADAGLLPSLDVKGGSSVFPGRLDERREIVARIAGQLADGFPQDLADHRPGDDIQQVCDDLVENHGVRRLGSPKSNYWVALPSRRVSESQAGRALRRVLEMTGPLPWVDLLAAWARGRGRPPYLPLPSNVRVLTEWLDGVAGVRIRSSQDLDGTQVVEAVTPKVEMDRVGGFLLRALRDQPAGVARADLLESARQSRLQTSTVASAMTYHPALVSLERGSWALRTSPERPPKEATLRLTAAYRRPQPTTYTWSPKGDLILEFSVPKSPSPVIAVPSALAEILEGREAPISAALSDVKGTLTVRRARMWGFGAVMASLDAHPGERFRLIFDLIDNQVLLDREARRKDVR